MRPVKLVKLSWLTSQGSQTRYFSRPLEAAFFVESRRIEQATQEECLAHQQGDEYWLAGNRIRVETPRHEFLNIKASIDGAVALATRNIATEQAPRQPTLLQLFWGQPTQQPPVSTADPMDLDQSSVGASSGNTGYSSF